MKKVFFFTLIFFSSLSVADEIWKWNTTIEEVKTFGGGSPWVCFTIASLGQNLCFDSSLQGGDQRMSVILAAKMSGASVSVSYRDESTKYAPMWFDNYQVWHVWLEE